MITTTQFFDGLPSNMIDHLAPAYTASVGKTYEAERSRKRKEDEAKARVIQQWEKVHDALRNQYPALYKFIDWRDIPQDNLIEPGWSVSVPVLIPGCAPIVLTVTVDVLGVTIGDWARVGHTIPFSLVVKNNVPNVIVASRLVELSTNNSSVKLNADDRMVWEI